METNTNINQITEANIMSRVGDNFAQGSKLPGGATVIETKGNKVLASWRGEFVVWSASAQGECYWGHYFTELAPAYHNFEEATKRVEVA